MIFKQLPIMISDLNKLGIALKSLDAMKFGTVGVNLGNVEAYRVALKGLSVEQSVFALASKGATEEQIRQILVTNQATASEVEDAMAKAGLTTATQALTQAEMVEMATKSGVAKAEAEALLSKIGITATEEGQVVVKKQVTLAMLEQAVASGTLTKAEASQIATMLGLNAAETANIGITNVLTASFTKLWAVITAHPIGAILTAIGAVAVGTIAYINKVNKDAEKALVEAHENTEKALEDTKASLSNEKSELQSINSELEQTKEKIKEISSIGALTLADKNELDKLSIANSQLETQKTLLENNIKLKQKSAALEAKELLGTQTELTDYTLSDKGEVVENTEKYDYKRAAELNAFNLKEAYKIYARAIKDGNAQSQEEAKSLIDSVSGESAGLTSEILNIIESFKYDDGTIIEGYEDIYKEYMGMIYNIQSLTNPDTFVEISKSITSGTNIDYEKILEEAYKSAYDGNFDINNLNQDFLKALEDAGISKETVEFIFDLKQKEYQSLIDKINAKYNSSNLTYISSSNASDKEKNQAKLDNNARKNEIDKVNKSLSDYAKENPIEFQLVTSYDNDFALLDKYIAEEKKKAENNTDYVGDYITNAITRIYDEAKVKSETFNNETDILSFSDAWEKLKNSTEDATKGLADDLIKLAESGQLTVEALSEADTTDFFKKADISAEEAVKKINELVSSSTQLQSMSAQISKISDMLADKKNGTIASADDLASFDVEVRGLESWKEFENVMMSSNSTMEQCQQAANDLATEWVNNSNFLANLTEETKQSYITQLEKMGVENAEQVVLTALGASTEYATLAIAHNSDEKNRNIQVSTDLSNATADEIIQLINEGNASDETANSLYHYALEKSNASNLTLATAADCSNLYNLVSALGVASSALKNYAYAKRVLESAQKWDDSPLKDAAIANAENTLKSLEASATKDIKTVFDKTNNVKISPKGSSGYKPTSTGKSKSGGSGSSKSDTKQTIDWISRLLDVLQKKIDATKAKFDNLFTLKSKKNNLNTQINQTKALLTATNKAADKYKKQADKVGLSSSLKKKVQSGDYNISNYSSETADKIQKYQDYYDKYKELKQQADELTTDIRNLRTERYQLYVDDAQAKIAKSQVYAELDAGNYKEQNKHLEYQKKQLKTQYDYLKKIAKLNNDDVEYSKLKAEYQKELNDLTMQEFDNIANTYDNKVGLTNNKIKAFQDQISLLEAKGQKIGSALYTKQMSLNNINEKKLVAEREKLIKKLNEIPKGTDDWYKAQDTLFSVESDLVNVQIENANLQNSINQLKFDRFDDLLAKLNDIVDETDFLIDMLDSENFFDDNGKITDDGITAMGLTAQNYDTYLAEAEQYKQMLSDVKDMYDAGKISLEDYEEYQRTYTQGQRDAIKNANDCKKAVIDYVKQGLDAQNEALAKSVEEQKKLIQEQQKARNLNQTLEDQNKRIARLKKQLSVLDADSSEEARKTKRELQSELDDLLKEQENTLYEQSIEDQEKNLDELLENSEKQASDYLKNSEAVFVDALNYVNANTETVSKNLEKISSDLGYDISTNITDAWKDGGKAVDTYESILQGNIPKITTQIGLITSAWNEACEAAEKAAQAIVDATTDDYLEHTTIGANGNNNGNGSSSETKTSLSDIKNFITKNAKEAKNDKSYYAPLNQYIYDKTKGKVLSKENERKLAKLLNVDIKTDLTGDKGREELAKIRDALKLAGYSKGGVISELSDAIRLNGDTVLVSAKPGERMLTEQQNGYWEKWTQSLPNLMNLTDIIKPNVNIPTAIPTVNREQSPVYNIDNSITVEGVATNEIVKDMANVAKKQAENVISEINRRTYAKGVRWK